MISQEIRTGFVACNNIQVEPSFQYFTASEIQDLVHFVYIILIGSCVDVSVILS